MNDPITVKQVDPAALEEWLTHFRARCELTLNEACLVDVITLLEQDRDEARALLAQASVALANVSGALCDSGGVVPDEAQYGEAVRAIIEERDALTLRTQLDATYAAEAQAEIERLRALVAQQRGALRKALHLLDQVQIVKPHAVQQSFDATDFRNWSKARAVLAAEDK